MKIKLKYFSWIRIKLNKTEDIFDVRDHCDFNELKKFLISKDIFYNEIFNDESIKFFKNFKEIDNHQLALSDGDEIGLLPPVTGG